MIKRHRVFVLGGLLLVAVLLGALLFCGTFASNNLDRIRVVMHLTQVAKPTAIEHTLIVTPTEIVGYPRPELTIDDKILVDLNCRFLESGRARYCSVLNDTSLSKLPRCSSIYTPDALLGGLRPAYPLAECFTGGGKYVHQSGCNISGGTAFVIERKGRYEMIDSLPKLKSVYAPIETENEALSYAIAATGYSALYGTEVLSKTEYYVERLENTHVVIQGNDDIVRLYDYALCGCGQHETHAVDVAVSRQGDIRETY
jgi:hypothetical protein